MEQVKYWTWLSEAVRTKSELMSSRVIAQAPLYGDSWEEQAFAEDASGLLGGCIWPPRSYNCSFCQREFRSAQALGGHMNVHRRARARLRQSSVPQNQQLVPNPGKSFDFHEYPSDSDPRVSDQVSPQRRGLSRYLFSPTIKQELHKRTPVSSSSSSNNNRAKEEYYSAADLSETLNLFTCQARTNASSVEEVASCKRRKIDSDYPLSDFLQKLTPVLDRCHSQLERHKLCSNPLEELDLELRLGVK